jgi:hypothetical protein
MLLYSLYPILCLKWERISHTYSPYFISRVGMVLSLCNRKIKILSQRIDRAGYITIRLMKSQQPKTYYLHRLLAENFVPNPHNKPYVNHKNGIKTDNRIDNLEWVTHAENVQHAYYTGLNNSSKTKIIDRCTGKIYNSISHASRECKIKYSTCRAYLNGIIKSNKTCFEYLK